MASKSKYQTWSKQWLADIPVEVRKEIYRCFFRDVVVIVRPKAETAMLEGPVAKIRPHPVLNLIYTCKAVLHEAEPVFHEEAIFEYWADAFYFSAVSELTSCFTRLRQIKFDSGATEMFCEVLRKFRLKNSFQIQKLQIDFDLCYDQKLQPLDAPLRCGDALEATARHTLELLEGRFDCLIIPLALRVSGDGFTISYPPFFSQHSSMIPKEYFVHFTEGFTFKVKGLNSDGIAKISQIIDRWMPRLKSTDKTTIDSTESEWMVYLTASSLT